MESISSPLPTSALAANWPPEILQAYLSSVQKEHNEGHESDEAMSTDEEQEEGDSSATASSVASAFSAVRLSEPALRPGRDDIASDDDAFSSEDEFADDAIREEQRLRRELVLGRIPPQLLQLRPRALVDLHSEYMKQLDDADIELAELKGVAHRAIARRAVTTEYHEPPDVNGQDVVAIVRELRVRSRKDICDTDKEDLVRGLVLLAQALFRKEREIKGMYGRKEMDSGDDDDDDDD
ncbi:hypothetical protein AcV7_005539 [Taiwanofungus camphoratus]|nr:hypothetical protein AcV7_005539 [Antrodia cinnamomea]